MLRQLVDLVGLHALDHRGGADGGGRRVACDDEHREAAVGAATMIARMHGDDVDEASELAALAEGGLA